MSIQAMSLSGGAQATPLIVRDGALEAEAA
jgi:hypothetical protein